MDTRFIDLSDTDRMAKRNALEDAGAIIDGYQPDGIFIAFPRGGFCRIEAAARAVGFGQVENLHTFPLGSDNPCEEYRHDGSYPNSRGFWLRGFYRLLPEVAAA